MTNLKFKALGLIFAFLTGIAGAQTFTPDQRYKADILLVVAHPDDDTAVTSYLARAILDQHKRVAVVYCTRGDSGPNAEARERGRALGLVREIEGRRAMNVFGISNVWFLDGRDTSSQNVLLSLAAWPSASVLEHLVRIFRLTRPEVVITWLPSSVAGENHGDHQAAGVLATEAFDLAGDRTTFPSQITAPIRQFENAFEGLNPWQAKKLYYFTDAFDPTFFQGHGPEYSGKDVSPSRKSSYLQLAAQSAAAYYTQSPDPKLNRQIEAGKNIDEVISKLQEIGYLPDPVRLWLGKSHVKADVTADVLAGIGPEPIGFFPAKREALPVPKGVQVELGGPWGFYEKFWQVHELIAMNTRRPEIAVQPNDILGIPLSVTNNSDETARVTASVVLPSGWKLKGPQPQISLPAGEEGSMSLPVIAPSQEKPNFEEIKVQVNSGSQSLFQTSIFVKVDSGVAEQVK